jgi:error-prone DNA polymerase
MTGFAEFGAISNFSFLRGASHPEELVAMAHALGYAGLGLADRNSLAGVVRAFTYARERLPKDTPFRVVTGARLVFSDGTPDILAYPRDRKAYGRLTRLLTTGNLRAEKGSCLLFADDLLAHAAGLQLVVMEGSSHEGALVEPTQDGNVVALSGAVLNTLRPVVDNLFPTAEEAGGMAPNVIPFKPPSPHSPSGKSTLLPLPGEGAPASAGADGVSRTRHPSPFGRHPPRFGEGGSASGATAKAGEGTPTLLGRLAAAGARVWLGATVTYGPRPREVLRRRAALARATGFPLLATNDITMHAPERRPLSDVVACIREGVSLEEAGLRLAAHAERHLKTPEEMARLFSSLPEAMAETLRFLEGISFSLVELKYDYPLELRQGFATEQEALAAFAAEGAAWRYPLGVPQKIQATLDKELKAVEGLNYAAYFLTVHDIVRYARDNDILCQGRGSAANSVLCYCLGITEVDPTKHDLLFERFISASRNEPPDIDVDFEHERREEVMQYIYRHYGRLHAGLTATVVSYRTRSTLREVGKAFGLSDDLIGALTGTVWGYWSGGIDESETRRIGIDPKEPRMAMVLRLAEELAGFPRHLSQHTGGFVITRSRLDEVVPIAPATMEDRTTVEWDKDDLDALGILKIDILALGMLSCMRRGFDLLEKHYGLKPTLATLPPEEECVYAMIRRADTLGVFQIESRAQMSMLPRLKPKEFYDLVIEVAIVRPGPIQGNMVHPYLRRRQGLEPVVYPSDELEQVLKKTLGIPLFQEQAMRIAIVAAGFEPSEADRLRRAMATFKRVGTIGTFRDKMVEGMVARGYERDFALRCFSQIEGFGTYGFPESHAASFALLVYASSWLKCRYPDVFACALLNAQPMGFYAPAQIVRDAREHGVPVRPVDVNASGWDHALEPARAGEAAGIHPRHAGMRDDILGDQALRLGFRQIKGVSQADMDRLTACRGEGFDSVRDLWLRTGLGPAILERLAEADAFRSLGLDRRNALWAIRGLNRAGDKDDLPLFALGEGREHEAEAALPPMRLGEHVVEDFRHLSLSLKAHPVSFVRAELDRRRILRSAALAETAPGRRVTVAGLVLVRQRPGSAQGVIFMTIEDETGVANIIVWPKVFERMRAAVIAARMVAVTGKLQSESDVIHVVADTITDVSSLLGALSARGPELADLARADEIKRPQTFSALKRDHGVERGLQIGPLSPDSRAADRGAAGVMPKGRNFH